MLSMITECPVPAVSSTSFLQPLMVQWHISQIIDRGDACDCYFADNDPIAIGTTGALRLRGYKVPEQWQQASITSLRDEFILFLPYQYQHPRHYMG